MKFIEANKNFRHAEKVSIGDEILVNGIYKFIPEKVMNVSNIMIEGNIFLNKFKILANKKCWSQQHSKKLN